MLRIICRFLSLSLLIGASVAGKTANAQQVSTTDVMPSFQQHIERHAVGLSAIRGSTLFDDKVLKTEKPKKMKIGGFEIRASGNVKLDSVVSVSGKLTKITFGAQSFYFADLKMVFTYSSSTSSEKIVYPTGSIVDYPWKDSHPKGTITFTLRMSQDGAPTIIAEVSPEAGHQDRPNEFVKDYLVPSLVVDLKKLVTQHLGVQFKN